MYAFVLFWRILNLFFLIILKQFIMNFTILNDLKIFKSLWPFSTQLNDFLPIGTKLKHLDNLKAFETILISVKHFNLLNQFQPYWYRIIFCPFRKFKYITYFWTYSVLLSAEPSTSRDNTISPNQQLNMHTDQGIAGPSQNPRNKNIKHFK